MDSVQSGEVRKVALVTGAATGIGRACALQLGQRYEVWVGFHTHATAAKSVVEEIQRAGGRAYAIHIDYTDQKTIHAAYAQFVQHYQRWERKPQLSVFVSSAGTFGSGYRMLLDLEESEWDMTWSVNVTGVCNVVRQFLSLLCPQALIINISSMVAHLGAIGYKAQAHYAVTKAVTNHLFQALRQTSEWQDIRLLNLLPGLIDTGLLHDHLGVDFAKYTDAIPLGELALASVIADAVSFCASSAGSSLDAIDLLIDGGWSQKGWCRY